MPVPLTANYWGAPAGQPDMDPNEAARILAQHFGMTADPAGSGAVGDPTGAVALGMNRSDLQSELDDRIANERFAAALGPQTGFEPGSPGKRYVSTLPIANLVSDETRAKQLERDQASDPFTGAAEQGRVGTIQKALDLAQTTMRPEIGDAAKTVAERNAFAEFLKSHGMKLGEKMGEYEAGGSPAAYAAAMTPIRAQGSAEQQDVLDAANRRAIALANAKPVKYTATEQQMLDTANGVQEMGPKLLALLEQENPGIGQDPTKYGSWTDLLGKEIGGWIYRKGKTSTARRDQIDQMVGYLEASIPRMLVPGRVNQTQYNDLKLHTPQLGFSDGANYERLHKMLTVILPDVLRGVDEAHSHDPTSAQVPGQAADPYAPPTDQERGINPYAINR